MSDPNFTPHEPSYTVDEFCAAERISRVRTLRALEARPRSTLLHERPMPAHHSRGQIRLAARDGVARRLIPHNSNRALADALEREAPPRLQSEAAPGKSTWKKQQIYTPSSRVATTI